MGAMDVLCGLKLPNSVTFQEVLIAANLMISCSRMFTVINIFYKITHLGSVKRLSSNGNLWKTISLFYILKVDFGVVHGYDVLL